MTELFDIPESLSPRLRWMRENRIATHHAPHMEDPWLAVQLTEEHVKLGLDVGEAMAEECRLYDDSGLTAEASTEDEAVTALARKLGVRLWNENDKDLARRALDAE